MEKRVKTTVGSISVPELPWKPAPKPVCPDHKQSMAYQGYYHCTRCNWHIKQ